MLYLITAFKTEARPLIGHYRLQSCSPHGDFPVYENDNCALVVSGPGKAASAAAVEYLHACMEHLNKGIWVNVGIAGHDDFPVGTPAVAHKIVDTTTRQSWYPPQSLKHALTTAVLYTVDTPETGYNDNALYDMEAAGFYPAACAYATREHVQCCKVVSDNRAEPLDQCNPQKAGRLIEQALPAITAFIEQLKSQRHTLDRETFKDPAPFLDRWHFSVTQQHRLRRNLQRWAALQPAQDCNPTLFAGCRDATGVLNAMDERLNTRAPELFEHD